MVETLPLTRVTELSYEINRLHLNYLQADESPQKIEQRIKLEGYIRKYLCHVAHDQKFIFPETLEILRRSVEFKENFSCYRATTAWNAIARYAANLVAQPWRKEFFVIKTFSGFYMHDIEENLVGAELLLACMGYKQVDSMSLILQQPLDLDAVVDVSRDALIAFVECQMMKEIWEGVTSQFECSWLDILNFRETHICSPDSAIKGLIHRYHQSQYQHHLLNGVPYNTVPQLHHHPDAGCLYGQTSMPYYGYPYAMSTQPRYACLISPQQAVNYPLPHLNYHQQSRSPSELLPVSNGYVYPHAPQMLSPHMHNGYGTSMPTSTTGPHNYSCTVPTGQLIELDSSAPPNSQTQNSRLQKLPPGDLKTLENRNGCIYPNSEKPNNVAVERQSRKDVSQPGHLESKSSRPTTLDDLRPRRNGVHPGPAVPSVHDCSYFTAEKKQPNKSSSRKGTSSSVAPMQDGTGTWESWDYVYRNLESQGYNKDVGERGDILHTSCTQRESVKSAGSSHSFGNTNISNSLNIRSTEASEAIGDLSAIENISSTVELLHLNEESREVRGVDVVDSRVCIPENCMTSRGSPHREKAVAKGYTNKMLVREQQKENEKSLLTLDSKGNNIKAFKNDIGTEKMSYWECVFCTYHNELKKDVCEMCGKSRQPGNEDKPLVSGGRECPKCTLVNERGVSSCQACNESLKNSPTYI